MSTRPPSEESVEAADERALLVVRGVAKSYGAVQALKGVDCHVHAGEVLALVGDNGAGKSTLLKIIVGAISPDRGSIYLDGDAVAFRSPRDSADVGISTVYQNLALVDTRDVLENLFLGREPTRWAIVDRRRMLREATDLLEDLGIRLPSLGERVANLSGGQRQAVAIARALLQGSRLIIMDEPTAALGVEETERVLNLVRTLRERGVAVIIVSHNLYHVFEVGDRITVLRSGQCVGTLRKADTRPDEVVGLITGADLVRRS